MSTDSKNPMIKDPYWEKALHGEYLATIIHRGKEYRICTAKVIDRTSGRCENPYALAVRIMFRDSFFSWLHLPWVAVCDANDEEMFLIQTPKPSGAVGLLQMCNRAQKALEVKDYGVSKWLTEHGVREWNDYTQMILRFKEQNDL